MSRGSDYSRQEVVDALRAVGVRPGDAILSHTSVGMLGIPAEGLSREAVAELFFDAFTEAVGPDGAWMLPAYTYSYTRGEPYDPNRSPPVNMGLLPEMLWQREGVHRSLDPIFSVIGFGMLAGELLKTASSDDCFGPESFYARLLEVDGAVCNVGIGAHSAFVHHVEQTLGVPYRYPKPFEGVTIVDGRPERTVVSFNVRSLDEPRHLAYFMRLDRDGRADGSVAAARVGRGEINLIRVGRMEQLIRAGLERDPEYLVLGARSDEPA